jgi:ABC-type transport system substrate-binding protein
MSGTRPFDRRALLASGAAAALLAASGVSAASLPRQGGRLRMALSGGARDDVFDPRRLGVYGPSQKSGLFLQVAMVGAIFETLTEIASDGTLRGELATSWRSNAEAVIWDFDLREDVRFHNGAPFTSGDLVLLESFANISHVLHNVDRILPLSRHSVRFTLWEPDPQFPFVLANPQLAILPERDLMHAVENGIGTGPYRLRKFDAGRHLIADRVERHYKEGRAAWFDSVELVGIASDAVRAEALRTQMVDVADLSHAADLPDTSRITLLPEEGFMSCAVDKGVALPAQIGGNWPMDNLRAPQRWWMA